MKVKERVKTVGSLFSGIGGLELGLERTGHFKTIWNCEIEPHASFYLKRNFPGLPNLGDVKKVNWNAITPPQLVCGGFPCQDISVAGKGAGIKEGTRSGLWVEFAKALSILRPEYALVENVSALTFRGLLTVLGDLAEIGFDAEGFALRASDVGAPHRRERFFVVAHLDQKQREKRSSLQTRQPNLERGFIASDANHGCESKSKVRSGRNAFGGRFTPNTRRRVRDDGANHREERQVQATQERGFKEGQSERNRRFTRIEQNSNFDSADTWSNRIQRSLSQAIRRFGEFEAFENCRSVEDLLRQPSIPEPLFRRVNDGLSKRVDCPLCGSKVKSLETHILEERIKCLGNAVVPQVAQVIGEAILESERNA